MLREKRSELVNYNEEHAPLYILDNRGDYSYDGYYSYDGVLFI